MSCLCCSLPAEEETNPLIVDVMKIIGDEAWTTFRCSLGYFRRKLIKRSNYIIEVPENYFAFDQKGEPRFTPVDQLLGNCLGNLKALSMTNLNSRDNNKAQTNSPTTTSSSPKKMETSETVVSNGDALQVPTGGGGGGGDVKDSDSRPDQAAVSLDTTFCNGTAEKQTYQFKFSKVRTSKLDVSYNRGFTVGGKASFSIGLPKSLASGSLGLSAEKRLEVRKSQGQTFEESITMEATSDINVAPKSKYVAKVQLEERTIHATFQVRIRMSMPQGRAPVYIRRKSDNVLVNVYNVTNLEDIFLSGDSGSFPSARKVPDDEVKDGGGGRGDIVDFLVEGVVKGNLACDHTIDLSSDEKDKEKE